MKNFKRDLVILGGGIAGLWIYNQLKKNGFDCILLEKNSLGGTQSLASQGMIHGGQRYALQGKASEHSETISEMPNIWADCLAGNRFPDLSSANILADKQYMWSPGGLTSNVTSFFASKAMNSRVNALEKDSWPQVFADHPKFKGKIYELDEVCIDVKSVIKALADNYPDDIYTFDDIQYQTLEGRLNSISINNQYTIEAEKFIFAAGLGNEDIAKLLAPKKKITQRRPLKQILVREMDDALYAHCIAMDPRPRVTISAHPLTNGKFVWYLGGLVAVKALETTEEKAIDFARTELTKLFPHIDWKSKSWETLEVDRAEPYTATGFLPEGSALTEINNCLLAWPTKLTFAPQVANTVLNKIKKSSLQPKVPSKKLPLAPASYADYPWAQS